MADRGGGGEVEIGCVGEHHICLRRLEIVIALGWVGLRCSDRGKTFGIQIDFEGRYRHVCATRRTVYPRSFPTTVAVYPYMYVCMYVCM